MSFEDDVVAQPAKRAAARLPTANAFTNVPFIILNLLRNRNTGCNYDWRGEYHTIYFFVKYFVRERARH